MKLEERVELVLVNGIVKEVEKNTTRSQIIADLQSNLDCGNTYATALYEMGIIWHKRLKILLITEDSDIEDEFEDAFEAVTEPEPAAEAAPAGFAAASSERSTSRGEAGRHAPVAGLTASARAAGCSAARARTPGQPALGPGPQGSAPPRIAE